MALVADIFTQNAWGVIEVQEEIVEKVDFKPQLLGTLGLFAPIYSRSRTIGIVDRDGSRTLIPTSPNGAPPEELIPKGARLRTMEAVRLAKGSTIYAIELAGVLACPSMSRLSKSPTKSPVAPADQGRYGADLGAHALRCSAGQGPRCRRDHGSCRLV